MKQEKWDEAISCYNRAIELVKDDAIYYANRGLCYLKKDWFVHLIVKLVIKIKNLYILNT